LSDDPFGFRAEIVRARGKLISQQVKKPTPQKILPRNCFQRCSLVRLLK
jgi:hypothetical protein